MFVKLAVLACSVAVSLAAWHGPLAGGKPADLYPAGVSPQACPNFPHCDNPAVAANPSAPAHGAYHGAGAWNGAQAGGWNGAQAGAWNGAHAASWNGAHAGAYNDAHNNGQWNGDNGAWNGHQNALDSGAYTGDGDYRGEGLAESGAFGPAHHDNSGYAGAHAYAGAHGHHGHAAQVPAGVDAHSCPNYPFCH